MKYVVSEGYLKVLKWLRSENCHWDQYTCSLAVRNGHLDVLKLAKENGQNLNVYTYVAAALNQQSKVLKWGIEMGCLWDRWIYLYVIKCRPDIKNWLDDNGFSFRF